MRKCVLFFDILTIFFRKNFNEKYLLVTQRKWSSKRQCSTLKDIFSDHRPYLRSVCFMLLGITNRILQSTQCTTRNQQEGTGKFLPAGNPVIVLKFIER